MGLRAIAAAVALGISSSVNAAFMTFEYTGAAQEFVVPIGVNSVNVLVVGGGGGGANGHQGGGGAGFLSVGTFAVTPGDAIPVTVGAGGTGALDASASNAIVGLTAGSGSAFGAFLSSDGGGVVTGINLGGHNGSSGGGAACNSGSLGGSGGSGGSNGQPCITGASMPIGLGQGDYTGLLSLFVENNITAGSGGAGGTGSHAGGGGAGGVLINSFGPAAQDGNQSWSGKGGLGYGAGGGAGGFDFNINGTRYGGGDGVCTPHPSGRVAEHPPQGADFSKRGGHLSEPQS